MNFTEGMQAQNSGKSNDQMHAGDIPKLSQLHQVWHHARVLHGTRIPAYCVCIGSICQQQSRVK
jgi:hypothetical protein